MHIKMIICAKSKVANKSACEPLYMMTLWIREEMRRVHFDTVFKSIQRSKFTEQSPWEDNSRFGSEAILHILPSVNNIDSCIIIR